MIWNKKPRRAYMEQVTMYERPGLVFSLILQNKTWASFILDMDEALVELRWNGRDFLAEDWPLVEKYKSEVHEVLRFLFGPASAFQFAEDFFPEGGCIYVENTNLIPALPRYKASIKYLNRSQFSTQ